MKKDKCDNTNKLLANVLCDQNDNIWQSCNLKYLQFKISCFDLSCVDNLTYELYSLSLKVHTTLVLKAIRTIRENLLNVLNVLIIIKDVPL